MSTMFSNCGSSCVCWHVSSSCSGRPVVVVVCCRSVLSDCIVIVYRHYFPTCEHQSYSTNRIPISYCNCVKLVLVCVHGCCPGVLYCLCSCWWSFVCGVVCVCACVVWCAWWWFFMGVVFAFGLSWSFIHVLGLSCLWSFVRGHHTFVVFRSWCAKILWCAKISFTDHVRVCLYLCCVTSVVFRIGLLYVKKRWWWEGTSE
jgi:hypothetical protein